MTTETALVDSALRTWQQVVDRADKYFSELSEEQLQQEVAPGKNRLIYIWGHLAAANDALLPLLGLGERIHPELDRIFIRNPDRSQQETLSGAELKQAWDKINQTLWSEFLKLSASEWAQKHAAVSEADFSKEPHRNRFTVLLSRIGHVASHHGQAILVGRNG